MRVLKAMTLCMMGLAVASCDTLLPNQNAQVVRAKHNVPGYYGTGHDDELCEGPCDCPESGYYYNGYREHGWRYCIIRK